MASDLGLKADGPEETQQVTYLCRGATALLSLGQSIENRMAEVESIRESLESDPRVIWAELERDQNPDFISIGRYYPDSSRTSPEGLITGSDAFRVLRFDQPIVFKVVVPIKNQPQHHNADDIPTDTYWVAWNGVTALVMWRHYDSITPRSGGHVVFGILEDAVAKRGHALHIQACSPGCKNIFLHTNLILTPKSECSRTQFIKRKANDVYLMFAEWESEKDSLIDLFYDMGGLYRNFALQQNTGRRIIALEAEAYSQLLHLVSHYAEHAKISATSLPTRLLARWKSRGWRSEVRHLSAQVWLCVSSIELLRRAWADEKKTFDDYVDEAGLEEIFFIDYGDDVAKLETIDLSRLESLCSQVEARLDNTALSWAATGGAVAGAVTGSLASLLF
ncbi:hypothetical protein ACWCQF_10810 [Streptomyces rubiginosohelvolus]|uniref:hypothetical protein n=1 Tax=Streptomyces rubiginosohelvolus TaxID=67362 RepID=UPI00364BF044